MTTVTHGTDGYLLGDSPAELQHLTAQAEVYAAGARELLGRIRPVSTRPGHRRRGAGPW
jgi:hypothetical protein